MRRTRVIRLPDHVLFILELDHDTDRPEDLFLYNLHFRLDVREDGGLNEVALLAMSLASVVDGGAVLLAGLDVAHDTLVLDVRDLGSLVNVAAEGVTHADRSRLLSEALEEFVVDARLDEDTGSSAARLTVVPAASKVSLSNIAAARYSQDTVRSPVDSLVQVGIVEDDVGTLAS